MAYWKEMPYRGERKPKLPRARKQVRNLRAEKLRDLATVWTFGGLSILALIIGLVTSGDDFGLHGWGSYAIIFLLGMTFTLAIADGTKKINKFRKGYDFDSSPPEKSKKDDNEHRSPSVSPDPW